MVSPLSGLPKLKRACTTGMTEEFGTFLSPSELQIAQEEMALICLEVLKTKDPELLENSFDALEHRSFELFKDGRHRKHTETYRTIIDGFLSLLRISSSLKKQLLSCCLLLSCCSTTRWTEFLKSGILSIHSEFAILVAEAMACTNPVWSGWEPEDLSLIARTLMAISLPSRYEDTRSLPTTTSITPLNIAISTCLSYAAKSETGQTQYPEMLIRKIANHTFPEAWESVRNEDLVSVLKFLPKTSSISKELELVCHVRISWHSQIRQMFRKSGSICPETALVNCGQAEENYLPRTSFAKGYEVVDFRSVKSIGDAYMFGEKLKQTADEDAFESASKFWLQKEQPELVAAAYVAAPNRLRSKVEGSPRMQHIIESFPKGLSSDLDTSIDANLSGLLESIPEIAEVYGVTCNPNPHYQHRQLRRAAILHPLLMVRRTDCLCAAGTVVLYGLSTLSQTYSEEAFEVVAILLSVVSELPYATSGFRKTISAFIVKVFLFLVNEGRLTNGIPQQFERIAVGAFKSIPICIKDDFERSILGLLPMIIDANKQNETLLLPLQKFYQKLE